MSELTKIENGKVRFELRISAEEYTKALNSAYRRLGGKYTIPGFRKGKAPRRVIENSYGHDVFWDNEFDALVQHAYSEALAEHNVTPELQPKIVFTEVSEENGIAFTAEVVLRPEVKLGQYKGIEAEKTEYNVTDEDVNKEIDRRRESMARTVNVERPVQEGDTVVLDFAGFLGEEQFEGGTAENYSLKIGSHTFIPGFEEQMVGMNIGETRDLNVTFPADYQAENLAGKDVIFKVTVHSISVDELPEFDADFVQDTSEFDTVEDYTADVRRELEERAAMNVKNDFINKVVQTAIDNAEVEIHEDIINEEIEGQIQHFSDQLRSLGTDLDGYLEYANLTIDDIRADYRKGAESNLKSQYVLLAIIEAENIQPNEDNYRNAIRESEACRREHWDDARIEEELAGNRMRYASAALYDATFSMLVENAVAK
ncbi:MAG: trigger factor [Christensenellaceae bacterium]|nr:trigger factor [Christensenellaceae bacterium]